MDWPAHYDSIYSILGVSATIAPADDSGDITVTAIDKTAGVDISSGGTIMPTIAPAARVRTSELDAHSVPRNVLQGGVIEINGNIWRIANTKPLPGPDGKGSGEILLILEAT